MPIVLRRVLISAGVGTWCFLNTWAQFGRGVYLYHFRYNPLESVIPTVAFLQILITLIVFTAGTLWRPANRTLVERLFLIALIGPLGIVAYTAFPEAVGMGYRVAQIASLLVLIPYLWIVWCMPTRAGRIAREAVLYSWPLLTFVYYRAVRVSLARYPRRLYTDGTMARRLPVREGDRKRAVWIIFDEMSETLAFEKRPTVLQMPEFDALRKQSFFAANALAPARYTLASMPSLVSGIEVERYERDGPALLRLATANRPEGFSWDVNTTVFAAARSLGFNTGLAGWYHPYCRMLNGTLTNCAWTSGGTQRSVEEIAPDVPFPEALGLRSILQVFNLPLVGHSLDRFRIERVEKTQHLKYLVEAGRRMAADASLGLVLLHLPTPHPPFAYDRAARRTDVEKKSTYLDSLAEADSILGEIRRSMEKARLWEETTVIVSSDHPWRPEEWRKPNDMSQWTSAEEQLAGDNGGTVPFLVKFPNQRHGLEYTKPVRTIVTRDLILKSLRGEMTTADSLASWLSAATPESAHRN